MNRQRRQPYLTVLSVSLAIGMLLSGLGGVAVAAEPGGDPTVWLNSRFILWDNYEKMIDSNFTIVLSLVNESRNHTGYYEIQVDNLYYNGTFQYLETFPFDLENVTSIGLMLVRVDNETLISAQNVIVRNGVTTNQIYNPGDPWLVSLNPMEWRAKEWNIFFSVVTAALVSVIIAYRLVTKYRRYSGHRVIE